MDVSQWKTTGEFFPWPHVQKYLDRIDSSVYRIAIEFAQQELLVGARPCPVCGRSAVDLFWFSVSDKEAAWKSGRGRVGFLTICEPCQLQVDFLVDRELTEMQAEQWRECRTLS